MTKALAQGFGGKIKDALTKALKLAPSHADAHAAFGAYQAEVINKVGALVAGMTYGAKKDSALEHYQQALRLNPESAISRIEYANGLIMVSSETPPCWDCETPRTEVDFAPTSIFSSV